MQAFTPMWIQVLNEGRVSIEGNWAGRVTGLHGCRAYRRHPRRVSRSWRVVLFCLFAACAEAPIADRGAQDPADPATPAHEVFTYRACSSAAPGALLPSPHRVPAGADPVASVVVELVKGVNAHESALGCVSFFSPKTQGALRSVHRNERGDTLLVDFRNFTDALPDTAGVTSFLPPGIMAELTWTLFQFDEVEAVRFSFDGDEQAFWHWLGGPGTPVEVFTRTNWEQI